MKFKKIPKNYIKICLDRLTRFKPVYEKYNRVFYDIVSKFLILETKKEQADKFFSASNICEIASQIFNYSIPYLYDSYLSDLLFEEESSYFYLEEEDKKFLKSGLNITGAAKYIDSENIPVNLKRLKFIEKNRGKNISNIRKSNAFLFPITKIVLTEGATEEILLSKFAGKLGYDFNKEGVYLIGAGGKNQVARKYYKMTEEVKLPIFILLDSDALETKELIANKIKGKDMVYVIKNGEFEDILTCQLVIDALNLFHKNDYHCEESDFDSLQKMTKNLRCIYKNKGFGEYKKAEFAKIVENYLNNCESLEVSQEIRKIIYKIKSC